jgi:heme/copper-type cytochrome/quinol oxidase subunit 3
MSTIALDLVPAPLQRRRQLLLGSAFAAGAASMLVLTLLGLYLEARHGHRADWLKQNNIPLTQPTMQFFTLVMSAVTVQWAVYSISRNDRGHTFLALAVSGVLGLAVLNQSWFLFTQIALKRTQVEGPYLYAVTGAHLAFLIGGLAFLLVQAIRALGGALKSRRPDGLSAAALFWHVQVFVYGVIWLSVYVAK